MIGPNLTHKMNIQVTSGLQHKDILVLWLNLNAVIVTRPHAVGWW
jgi:hypothetical protein